MTQSIAEPIVRDGTTAQPATAAAPAPVPPPPPRASRRRARRLVPVIAVAAVLGGLVLAARPGPDIVQAMADGDNITVSGKVTARVARLRVREGERVSAGQVLFDLESPEVDARRRQAGAVLDAARAQQSKAAEGTRREDIQAAEANWRRAEAAAELAQSTFRRTDTLFREGVVTEQRYDEARAQVRTAVQASALARAQYDEALAGARRQDRDAANAQVRQAEGAVAEVQAAQDELQGRAPIAGEVSKRLADLGELVPAGYPVFTLVNMDSLWVAMHLREDQFRGVRIGATFRGDIPALALKGVPFTVYFIGPAGDFATWRATRQSAGYDVKSFEVRVRPARRIADLRPGMSVLFRWPRS
jgi:HlyD family secretion protein